MYEGHSSLCSIRSMNGYCDCGAPSNTSAIGGFSNIPPTEMKSLRDLREKLDQLLAIKDDTIRFRELLLKAIHESEGRELSRWQAVQNDHNNALNVLSSKLDILSGQIVKVDGAQKAIGNLLGGLLALAEQPRKSKRAEMCECGHPLGHKTKRKAKK